MMDQSDYERIESEISSDASPVGIDAKKTHVLILGKLESIERRLEALERTSMGAATGPVLNGVAAATDAFDEEAQRLAARDVDVDARLRGGLRLLEKASAPETMRALETIVDRLAALAPAAELASHGPDAFAAATDAFDEEIGRLAARGIDVDSALRNGIAAVLYLGQRVSTGELEALGTLLRSDVLHPAAVDIVGRLGQALVAASSAPAGSVGPFGAVGRLGDRDARRSTAFALEFARQFGAALDERARSNHEGDRS